MEKNIPHTARGLMACLLLILMNTGNSCRAQGNDIKWLRSINGHRNAGLDKDMYYLGESAYGVAAVMPLAQLIYGYAAHDKHVRNDGWTTVAGLGVDFALTYGLKYAVNRTRPYITYPDIQAYKPDNDPSFPSGHTSFAFCTATMLTLQYPKWYVIVPAYLWASAVGYSRLDIGMHYPSDVVVGAIVGAGSAYISYKGMQWLHKNHVQKKMKKFHEDGH